MSNRTLPDHVMLWALLIALLLALVLPVTPLNAVDVGTPVFAGSIGTAQPPPQNSLIEALLGRYAVWLMLVICSSMLALLGAAAIVTRIRRLTDDDNDR
ncbi:MAG: hypothetical protein K6356_15200 [Chloroflexus sp.]